MFGPGNDHLELVFEFGLGTGDGGPWRRRVGEATESITEMLDRQLGWAGDHGFTDRLDLLARHGLDLDRPLLGEQSDREPLGSLRAAKKRPDDPSKSLHQADWDGDLEGIRALLDAGADPSLLDDRFHATPNRWAVHAYQTEAAELLRSVTPGADRSS